MFAKMKDSHAVGGYRKIAISEFYRTENDKLGDGIREYVLILADGGEIKQVLSIADWEELESSQQTHS